jgi:putative transposase
VDNSNHNPGNANLRIGAPQRSAKRSVPENDVPSAQSTHANLEIGAPRWHSRGYLPHFDDSATTQHVTFHLADSLPKTVLLRLDSELNSLPADKRPVERRKRIDSWIDAGHGSCTLRIPAIAAMVQESLLAFDSQRYRLLAWAVMPNHVHALFEPINAWTVAKIVASWKQFTATRICDQQSASGKALASPIWHREYWDRFIRDKTHLLQAIQYIHQNPVKAALAPTPEAFPWSSAFPGNANLRIGGLP